MQFVRAKNHHTLARAHTHTDEFNVQEGSDSDNEHAFHDGLCRRHFFVSCIIQLYALSTYTSRTAKRCRLMLDSASAL